MKKILLMALALTGLLSMTTACSDDDSDLSNLPAFDSSDFDNRIQQPEWTKTVTWQDEAARKTTYDDFVAADGTLVFEGVYEYKEGMNYSTGQTETYWYYTPGKGTNIFLSEGNLYMTSFNKDLDNLKWSAEVRDKYDTVWNYYCRKSRLTYTFLVKVQGSFSANGMLSLDGAEHQVTNVVPEVKEDKANYIKAAPAKMVISFGDLQWNQYALRGPLYEISTGSRYRTVYVDDVRQTVLGNLTLIEEYFETGSNIEIAGATEDQNFTINLDEIRKALGQ